MLEYTLQDYRDSLIRDHALRRVGRNRRLLKRLLPHKHVEMAMVTPDHNEEPIDPLNAEDLPRHLSDDDGLVAVVKGEIWDIDNKFWREVALDLDRKKDGKKTTLTLIGDVPDDPRQARVTSTSAEKLLAILCGPGDTQGGDVVSLELDPSEISARERNLLRMLALAARRIAKLDSRMAKKGGGLNLSSIAHSLVTHIGADENKTGLSADNLSRAMSAGLKELGKV